MQGYAIFSATLYTAGWLFCVLSGASQVTNWPILFTALTVSLQLLFLKKIQPAYYYLDLLLLIYAAALGFLMEMAFLKLGLLQYATTNSLSPSFPPGWIWCLYFLFALTLNHSLLFLSRSAFLPFLFGLFGGPLSYFAGEKLGAVTLLHPYSLILLGLFWGSYLLIVSRINQALKHVALPLIQSRDKPIVLFYDSVCPICSREINHLKNRKHSGSVRYFDLAMKKDFEKEYPQIDYLSAMKEIHAIGPDGSVLKGIDAFSELYARTGLTWLALMLQAPLLRPLFAFAYSIWAKYRLQNRCKIEPLDSGDQ